MFLQCCKRNFCACLRCKQSCYWKKKLTSGTHSTCWARQVIPFRCTYLENEFACCEIYLQLSEVICFCDDDANNVFISRIQSEINDRNFEENKYRQNNIYYWFFNLGCGSYSFLVSYLWKPITENGLNVFTYFIILFFTCRHRLKLVQIMSKLF